MSTTTVPVGRPACRRVAVVVAAHLIPVVSSLAVLATQQDPATAVTVTFAMAAVMLVAGAPWRHGDVRRAGAR